MQCGDHFYCLRRVRHFCLEGRWFPSLSAKSGKSSDSGAEFEIPEILTETAEKIGTAWEETEDKARLLLTRCCNCRLSLSGHRWADF